MLALAAGLVAGALAMLPIARVMLRRAERRARQAERRARDAERLAELGSMTGGLAHEIKNPLSTVGLNAQLLAESIAESALPPDQRDRILRRLNALSREIERLRGILTDFLQFAGRMKLDPQPRNLVKLIDEICDFFQPQCASAGVTLRTKYPPSDRGEIVVLVDEGLLKQALLNLMLNATQAMSERPSPPASGVHPHRGAEDHDGPAPESSGNAARPVGELILSVEADADEARMHVIDTGPGISRERIDDIFRPYFSLRSGGTGLGLPTARRIIHEHAGRLTVHSEPGRGSDFTIHLPRHASAPA